MSFLIHHEDLKTADLDKYLTSIDEIERRSGVDLLALLANAYQAVIESIRPSNQQ